MSKKYIHLSLVGALILSLCGNAVSAQENGKKPTTDTKSAKNKTGEFGNVDGVTADQIKDYLSFIASDEMAGRATPSQGLDITAKFIATHLSRWGFKPAGTDGTFLQKYRIKRKKMDREKTVASFGTTQLKHGTDFIASPNGGTGKVSGGLVYVGHGRTLKSKNIDPYKGLDIKDKILLVAMGMPKGVTREDYGSGKMGIDFDFAETYAATHGAKGIIYIPNKSVVARWKERYDLSEYSSWKLGIATKTGPFADRVEVPRIVVSPAIAEQLLKGEKLEHKAVEDEIASGTFSDSFALSSDKTPNFEIVATEETGNTQNVVGILEGSDPVLKNEYVAIGAHYDHVGMNNPDCPPVGNDNICNGADDDGSGTAAVLAIADAMSHGPKPKRSILFVWHSGEEMGLWGSEYIVENPPVPLTSIIAQFNIDMIGRSRKEGDTNPKNKDLSKQGEVYVIGSTMMSTGLAQTNETVNKAYLNLTFNYKYDDPNDKEKFFYRSDHYNYAKKGIPILFYFTGVHEDYHMASDSVDKIDFQQMEKISRTIMATVWKSAHLPKRFVVDKPLPEQLQ